MMNSLAKNLSQLSLKLTPRVSQNMVAQRYSVQKTVKRKEKPLNKAICLYMERAKAHEERMLKESELYKRGKRFLARMMGEDPTTFTDRDVDRSIQYLLPSSLSEKHTRPVMKPPEQLFPAIKDAAFDIHGRPHHYLFYTKFPEVYEIQHKANRWLQKLDRMLDDVHSSGQYPLPEHKFNPTGTEWKSESLMEKEGNFNLKTKYDSTIAVLQRLLEHPMSESARDFLMKYRTVLTNASDNLMNKKPVKLPDGRKMSQEKAGRKSSRAVVSIISPGKGVIEINKVPHLAYFTDLQAREQVLSPLLLTETLGKYDIHVRVHGGGENSQAGAIKLGIAKGLKSFLPLPKLEQLLASGFLTRDPRVKERKKPGKMRARRGYTWLKR